MTYLIKRNLNPIIDLPVPYIGGGTVETKSQYVPTPILLNDGTIIVYVKGDDTRSIFAYESTDNGQTYNVMNGGLPVLTPTPSSWDSGACLDPAAVFDSDTNTIHLYYKGIVGTPGYGPWAIGYATASGNTPSILTKDLTNPLLTSSTAASFFGLSSVTDICISSVTRYLGNWFFYGTYRGPTHPYKIFYCKGGDWTDLSLRSERISPMLPYDIVQSPCIFKRGASYKMLMTEGYDGFNNDYHQLVQMSSNDMANWTRDGVLMEPGFGWDNRKIYCAQFLRKNTGEYNEPVEINGKWLLYYSATDNNNPNKAKTGLALIEPCEVVNL